MYPQQPFQDVYPPEQIDAKTRDRVMESINKLSYSTNFGAKIMAARRANTIDAIIPTMKNSIFARDIRAFQEELNTHGYTLIAASPSCRATTNKGLSQTLRRGVAIDWLSTRLQKIAYIGLWGSKTNKRWKSSLN